MIRLNKLTDYGIVLMTYMAREIQSGNSGAESPGTVNGQRALYTARDLAAQTRIPLPTVSKLLKQLSNAGLLVSHRGVKGGYSLARAAQETSVGQIIAAIEGPIVGITECSASRSRVCELEPHCPISANWKIISHTLREALETLTLRDLLHPIQFIAKPAAGELAIMNLPNAIRESMQ
jgi:FeS assembly SUF system regulator